jgi:hypothetical protein
MTLLSRMPAAPLFARQPPPCSFPPQSIPLIELKRARMRGFYKVFIIGSVSPARRHERFSVREEPRTRTHGARFYSPSGRAMARCRPRHIEPRDRAGVAVLALGAPGTPASPAERLDSSSVPRKDQEEVSLRTIFSMIIGQIEGGAGCFRGLPGEPMTRPSRAALGDGSARGTGSARCATVLPSLGVA